MHQNPATQRGLRIANVGAIPREKITKESIFSRFHKGKEKMCVYETKIS